MNLSVTAVAMVLLMVMFAVLGHGAWHHGEIAVMNFIVQFFTGGHVTG